MMKHRRTSILAVILALFIVNTGFVRADRLLCRTNCEYSALDKPAAPSCCKTGNEATVAMTMAADNAAIPNDCPHLAGNQDLWDPLVFVASSQAGGVKNIAVDAAMVISPWNELPNTRAGAYSPRRSGLSPPHIISPPPYRLYCSLLI